MRVLSSRTVANSRRFSKSHRLLRKSDFKNLMTGSKRKSFGDFVAVWKGNSLGRPRLGLAASRKTGKSVARNRFKRIVREAFRRCVGRIAPLDILIISRLTGKGEFSGLDEKLDHCFCEFVVAGDKAV